MSWVHVVHPTEIKGFDAESGKTIAVLDLQVSTASDLPAIGDVVENYIIAAGSNAQIVRASTPTFVTLDGGDGNWYPEQSDSSASTLNASLSAPKNLGSIREEQPIEEIEEITEEPAVKEQKKAFEESIEEPEEKGGEDDDELL